ncbi:MAG: T9SS type A sorting domain-containing protein, partial [Bacteroidales bacterium]|nr:T9SS type A sorting domain-containing protein [Bacteroidales bacterium]
VSNIQNCSGAAIQFKFDNTKYITKVKLWLSSRTIGLVKIQKPKAIEIPTSFINEPAELNVNAASNILTVAFSDISSLTNGIYEVEVYGYDYTTPQASLISYNQVCVNSCVSGNGLSLYDGNTTSGGMSNISNCGNGNITLLFDEMKYVTAVKVWLTGQENINMVYPAQATVQASPVHSNGENINVNAQCSRLSFTFDDFANLDVREIKVYGYSYSKLDIKHIYNYDNAGNRSKRSYEVVYYAPEANPYSCSNYGLQLKASDDAPQEKPLEYLDKLAGLDLKLYPNPTYGELVIEIQNPPLELPEVQFELLTNDGRQVWSKKTNELQFMLNMHDYPSGNYLLRLHYQNEVQTYKIIKK